MTLNAQCPRLSPLCLYFCAGWASLIDRPRFPVRRDLTGSLAKPAAHHIVRCLVGCFAPDTDRAYGGCAVPGLSLAHNIPNEARSAVWWAADRTSATHTLQALVPAFGFRFGPPSRLLTRFPSSTVSFDPSYSLAALCACAHLSKPLGRNVSPKGMEPES